MNKVIIPPLKTQGIKTKLIPHILKNIPVMDGIYYEPFLGSGSVLFNIQPKVAIVGDLNPHIINFYNDIKNNIITPEIVTDFLNIEGEKLSSIGEPYYYEVRDRFNLSPNSLDFLFLNRCCFNGLMRFNRNGKFNAAFCRVITRFNTIHIHKITNQIAEVASIIHNSDYTFNHCSWDETINSVTINDFVYLDPPYYGLDGDYLSTWSKNKNELFNDVASKLLCRLMYSNWFSKKDMNNDNLIETFKSFNITKIEHIYKLGGNDKPSSVVEALIMNY